MRKPLIAGNWKMFKTKEECLDFANELKSLYHDTDVRAVVCAPFIYLEALKSAFVGIGIRVGAQNAYFKDEGPFTGEISVKMLEQYQVDYCIVGHSERRQYFGETDEMVNQKLLRLLEGPIAPILCIGEDLEEREQGGEFLAVRNQLVGALQGVTAGMAGKLVIAYEPVWAIGTGKTAAPEQAEEMCEFIRNALEAIYGEDLADQAPVLYGGSVRPDNIARVMNMRNIDGALVGGASLNVKQFMDMIDF